jgi:pilus assembly protein CpaE
MGRIVSFLGVKGGVGTTTLAVNLAIALAKQDKDVVLVDLNPHAAAVALQMDLSPRIGLSQIIDKDPKEISLRLIENCLEQHSSGVRVLAMPRRWADHQLELSIEQIAAVLAGLETAADTIILDMGNGVSPVTIETAKRCHLTVVVFEGDAVAISLASELVEKLDKAGVFGSGIGLVMVNRSRSASTYTRTEIEEQLGSELLALITPAPEVAFHANKTGIPILLSQPNTAIADQIKKLCEKIT